MPNFINLKSWLEKQNLEHKFAKEIKGSSTVYFSDDFAGSYDMMIKGFGGMEKWIVVQMDKNIVDFKEISISTWKKLNFEIWLIEPELKWIIISNNEGEIKLEPNDEIKSDRLGDFKFKLNQIKESGKL
jgi:hypothetical protein